MKQATENYNQLLEYVASLKLVTGVSVEHRKDSKKEAWVFSSSNPRALGVTLAYYTDVDPMIDDDIEIDIESADCAYWNTSEADIEFYVVIAQAALKGDVGYNITKFLRRKEVCFKVGKGWACTKLKGNQRIHYTKIRAQLRR